MPRGGCRVKPPKPAKDGQTEASIPPRTQGVPFTAAKPIRTNTDWKAGLRTGSFLSRTSSEPALIETAPRHGVHVPQQPQYCGENVEYLNLKVGNSVSGAQGAMKYGSIDVREVSSDDLTSDSENSLEPTSNTSTTPPPGEEENFAAVIASFGELNNEDNQASASSLYSRDSSSIYSRDSASIYSRDSASIYSSATSIYSIDECGPRDSIQYARNSSSDLIEEDTESTPKSRLSSGAQYQHRTRTHTVRRQESRDSENLGTSSLAKKAALFRNSRLPPQLPAFDTSLQTWSMVCRAAQASRDCYDRYARLRQGQYTSANSSKDIKAMIIDDQLIDNSRMVIVSVRGTESLTDWTVNNSIKRVKPVMFLDDEENACHAGFLQVAKAMVDQIATQLKKHPALSEQPSLLITGHSAGGAVAAMLYSHMLSTSVSSELTALAHKFSSINCVTFGAPPLSLKPLQRREHNDGIFLSFANEGDPVIRVSDPAYVKCLAKLITALPPSSITASAPQVKVVRRSRGTAVIRETVVAPAPSVAYDELPLFQTPPVLIANGGEIVLLRDKENGTASASCVTNDDMADSLFADLAEHEIEVYIRRVKEVALAAMMGRAL